MPVSKRLALCSTAVIAVLAAIGVTPTTFADTDAKAILQAAAAAMGGDAPTSSDATGQITITEGGATRSGMIRVLTSGVNKTSEILEANQHEEHIYNDGAGAHKLGEIVRELSIERSLSTYAVQFPLILIQRLLENPDTAYEYMGAESVDGVSGDHLRVWDTYASRPELVDLAQVSMREFWIDPASHLVNKIAFSRWNGRGAVFPIPTEARYSDYRSIAGKFYPFHVERTLNGSPWSSIQIDSVTMNCTVPDGAFSLE